MPEYTCSKCGRVFQQKSHLADHEKKKNDCSRTSRFVNEVVHPSIPAVEDASSELIALRREEVEADFRSAEVTNKRAFLEKDKRATAEYIFPNQREDAAKILDLFYRNKCRVISITKKTKVGMDGLMIEIARRMCTHPDDTFVMNPANVRILTGMSNSSWEKDFKDKVPKCFKEKIFHHGQLGRADLLDLRDSLIIIDEIDTGDKEGQVLHQTLKAANIMDVTHMEKNNIRFIVASASIIRELYDLYQWGDLHETVTMQIPSSYIGHKDFLDMGIIKEFYPLNTDENAEQWIQEDILDNYGTDYRVHIVRVNSRTMQVVQNACIRKRVKFHNHTSTDRLTPEENKELFENDLTEHHIITVKNLWRRANLFVDAWKKRIGATHELYTKVVDSNVQNQGLPGRMTGYWRSTIEGGHTTGPYRTSIKAIEETEEAFKNPFGKGTFSANGFRKSKNGKVSKKNTLLNPANWDGITPVELPTESVDINTYRIYSDEEDVRNVCKLLGYRYLPTADNADGFKETSLTKTHAVVSLNDAIGKVKVGYGGGGGFRVYYPCYVNTSDNSTLRFVVIIRPTTDQTALKEADRLYPSIPYTVKNQITPPL